MKDDEVVRMELKYCECCGGLLLRAAGNGAVYCAGCAPRMAKVAPVRSGGERRGRKPKVPTAVTVEIDAVAELELPPPRPSAGVGVYETEARRPA